VLHSGLPWNQAAARHFTSGARAAGNGSSMRTTPTASWFTHSARDSTMDASCDSSR